MKAKVLFVLATGFSLVASADISAEVRMTGDVGKNGHCFFNTAQAIKDLRAECKANGGTLTAVVPELGVGILSRDHDVCTVEVVAYCGE
ncbi:MAG: hypothetical protein AB7F59_06250 [Bdellovibrionales bacterium]